MLKDYFVYEGKDVIYLKNEKQRVRAACASENCSCLILTSWNSAHGCFQVKSLFNEHNCGRISAATLLIGSMPCKHAVVAMSKMGLRPEDFVHKWLTMEVVRATYSHCIKPVNSEEYWVQSNAPNTLPPPIKRAAHRPKMKRRSDPVKKEMNPNKYRKTFQNNSIANAEETTLDVAAKAKKNKKKLPKTSTRGQLVNHSQEEKINVSQFVPQADEVKNVPKLNL
ncbi:hypothetical protein Ahy_A01g001803 [Arachis hypogaea]|uniref:SWIM-type domain-containing protein n=1 Tax=Arachis hypogaea TaxID=3818 RepID=A0A445EPH6_ARAHY|nr:hypothetical protein Ahy_A01g001803 [Arachis hypogaea]